MKYRMTLRVSSYDMVGEKYQKVEATQKFIFQSETQLANVISSLARASKDELTVTVEKVEEEETNE